MLKVFSSSSLILCLAATAAFADHGKGNVGGKTVSPMTLHEDDASLELGLRFQDSRVIPDSLVLADVSAGHDTHRADWLFQAELGAAYGVSDRLTVAMSLPFSYVSNFHFSDDGATITTADHIAGFGDLSVTGKFSLLSGPVNVALIAGLQIPTGATNRTDDHGNLIEPAHQPGSGSWSPIVGIAAGMNLGDRIIVSTSLMWKITIQGQHQFEPGDATTLAAKFEYQVTELGNFPRMYVSLELALERIAQDSDAGTLNGDTGGYILSIGPGIRARLNQHLSVGLTVSLPIYQGLFGIQHHEVFEILSGVTFDF